MVLVPPEQTVFSGNKVFKDQLTGMRCNTFRRHPIVVTLHSFGEKRKIIKAILPGLIKNVFPSAGLILNSIMADSLSHWHELRLYGTCSCFRCC